MPEGNKRSRTFRRIRVRSPGATMKVVYKKRKPGKAMCGTCGKNLSGVIHNRNTTVKNTPKSSKRPARAYSNLCSACSRRAIIAKSR